MRWGEEGKIKLLEQNVRKRGCGEGDRANTPRRSQLKTKPAPACCFINACPPARGKGLAWGQRPTLSSHTAQHPRAGTPLRPAPGVHSSACLTLRGAHTPAGAHTYTHTPHTRMHLEPKNATVIQRPWCGRGSTRAIHKKG